MCTELHSAGSTGGSVISLLGRRSDNTRGIHAHLVPVPPTLTIAHSGEKPASRGSSSEAHAATTSSLVFNGFLEKAWAGKGWFASAIRAVDIAVSGLRVQTGTKTDGEILSYLPAHGYTCPAFGPSYTVISRCSCSSNTCRLNEQLK